MPSDDRLRAALDAFKGPVEVFHSTLLTTTDEVRAYLATHQSTWVGLVERVRAELGPLAAGRIDPERFAAIMRNHHAAAPDAVPAVEQALATLSELAARGNGVCRVDVPAGGNLYDTVAQGLAEIGRAFSAARIVQTVRTSHQPPSGAARPAPLPYARWTRAERRLAPPLVVTVQGSDLRAAGLAEFMDGRQRIVLIVEGECPPAPLVRLVAPGTFVLQTAAGAGLARLAKWDGPGVAALVPDSAARFVHDPSAGSAVHQRLTIEFVPDRPPRKAIGGQSAAQQGEDLELLRSLATRPAGAAPVAAAATPTAADPADKLAAWLLSRADLSELG